MYRDEHDVDRIEVAAPLTAITTDQQLDGRLGVGARIVMDPHGRPLRTIIVNGGKRITGFYVSRKGGTAMPYESFTELNALHQCEVDTDVEDYCAQPHRLEFIVGGEPRRYTPDIACNLSDGTVEIREVKGAFSPELNLYEARRHEIARTVYESLGWRFRVVRAADIERPSIAFANRAVIQRHAMAAVPADREIAALSLLARASTGIVSLGRLSEVLGHGPLGVARACALMVRRRLAIDLDHRLGPNSPVRRIERSRPAGAPTFRLLKRLATAA